MALLTVVFLLSFLQYCFDRVDAIRLIPVALLIASALALLLVSPRASRTIMFSDAGSLFTALGIAIACLPPLFASFYRSSSFPAQYGVLMIVALLAIRILLSGIGIEGIMLAFFYGMALGLLIVVAVSFGNLVSSFGAQRYAPPFFDANRIAFFAVASIPAQLWMVVRHGKKYALVLSALCVVVILASASRGSLFALFIGGSVALLLYLTKTMICGPLRISRRPLLNALAALCAVTALASSAQPAAEHVGRYLWTKLALDDRDRGLDSGFTGRSGHWGILLTELSKTSWVTGNGYRTTEEDFDFPLDNGYISSLYELGAISTAFILAKYALVFCWFSVEYLRARSRITECLLATVFTMVIFFSNAFVHRVLFGLGDPVSILALFWFVSNRQDTFDRSFPLHIV